MFSNFKVQSRALLQCKRSLLFHSHTRCFHYIQVGIVLSYVITFQNISLCNFIMSLQRENFVEGTSLSFRRKRVCRNFLFLFRNFLRRVSIYIQKRKKNYFAPRYFKKYLKKNINDLL